MQYSDPHSIIELFQSDLDQSSNSYIYAVWSVVATIDRITTHAHTHIYKSHFPNVRFRHYQIEWHSADVEVDALREGEREREIS